jgi:predicted nucleic acid-binding protein
VNLYFDTSALLKKYINEKGSVNVDTLLVSAKIVSVSILCKIEAVSAFKRLSAEKEISQSDYEFLCRELETDLAYFSVMDIDSHIVQNSLSVIDKYQLKSLDSIQLGTAITIGQDIDYFVACDNKLLRACQREGFKTINPNH